MKLRLIGDSEIGLPGGYQLWRVVGIRRRHELDVEAARGEVSLAFRNEERRVIGIDEPVQNDRQLLVRRGCRHGQQCQKECSGYEFRQRGRKEEGTAGGDRVVVIH